MNAKRCKKIRADLATQGIDVRNAEYQNVRHPGALDAQVILGRCGRNAYKATKQQFATAV
ncbi:hypothetical protein GOD54_23445 [Sinorhizobium medicae]|nr:hypothetical protein [Sinorhizobium medicae]